MARYQVTLLDNTPPEFESNFGGGFRLLQIVSPEHHTDTYFPNALSFSVRMGTIF